MSVEQIGARVDSKTALTFRVPGRGNVIVRSHEELAASEISVSQAAIPEDWGPLPEKPTISEKTNGNGAHTTNGVESLTQYSKIDSSGLSVNATNGVDVTPVISINGNGHAKEHTIYSAPVSKETVRENLKRIENRRDEDFGYLASDPRVIATHATVMAHYPRLYADSGIASPSDAVVRKGHAYEAPQEKPQEASPINLGPILIRKDIQSTEGPFLWVPEYRVEYPEVVTAAIADIYAEYNESFRSLVTNNREWGTDYQYAITPNGTPINGWVQIDMVGLSDDYLASAATKEKEAVREDIKTKIFEIENSLAMYQLLEKIFSQEGENTFFKTQFRASLDALRQRHRKPIALLAVTDDKYEAMRTSEFGKRRGEKLTDDEIRALSGFDTMFGPREFMRYLRENDGNCDYLLYARTSAPVAKLRDPSIQVDDPLLSDPTVRRIIKAYAVTLNIDNPTWEPGHPKRINDTKKYLAKMGMAYAIHAPQDLSHPEFAAYLNSQGVDSELVMSGKMKVHAKPTEGAYGCYGHIADTVGQRLTKDLGRNIEKRGPYVVQPEMRVPVVRDEETGLEYTVIDRNFFTTDGSQYKSMGGFRSFVPVDSLEAKLGRNHGTSSTVWAEIQ